MVNLDTLESSTDEVTAGSAQFVYTPLGGRKNVRLLTVSAELCNGMISCKLRVFNHSTCFRSGSLAYSCLSYVWGTSPDNQSILINGALFLVRRNLLAFLERARHTCPDELIWIDALCINQQDVLERNKQVQRMGDIYAGCRQVLIWLGPSPELDVVFEIATELRNTIRQFGIWDNHELQSRCHKTAFRLMYMEIRVKQLFRKFQADPERFLAGFEALAQNPYQYRAWIVQEVAISDAALLVNGQYTMPFEILQQTFHGGSDYFSLSNSSQLHERVTELYSASSWSTLWLLWNDLHDVDGEDDISWLIEQFAAHGCSDPRDRLYSMLALIQRSKQIGQVQGCSSNTLTVDYLESRVELFWRALAYLEGPPYRDNPWSPLPMMLDLCHPLEVTPQELIAYDNAVASAGESGFVFRLGKVRVLGNVRASRSFAQCPFAADDKHWYDVNDYDQRQLLESEARRAMTATARGSTDVVTLMACTMRYHDANHEHIMFLRSESGIYEVSKVGDAKRVPSAPLLHIDVDGKTRPVTRDDFIAHTCNSSEIRYGVCLPRSTILSLLQRNDISQSEKRSIDVQPELQRLRDIAAQLRLGLEP